MGGLVPDPRTASKQILLLEPDALLRHIVAMTARTLNIGHVHEAANEATAERLLAEKRFHGAIIAVRLEQTDPQAYDLSLLDSVRMGATVSDPGLPIAVMVEQCNIDLIAALKARAVSRVMIKPFRVRVLLDAIAELARFDDAMPNRSAREEGAKASPLPPSAEDEVARPSPPVLDGTAALVDC
jgi:DNA-binding NarL/FixJ family response regulator